MPPLTASSGIAVSVACTPVRSSASHGELCSAYVVLLSQTLDRQLPSEAAVHPVPNCAIALALSGAVEPNPRVCRMHARRRRVRQSAAPRHERPPEALGSPSLERPTSPARTGLVRVPCVSVRKRRGPRPNRAPCSLHLDAAQIAHEAIDHRIRLCPLFDVVFGARIVQLPTPDRHVPRTMSTSIPSTVDRPLNILRGEFAAVPLGNAGQVRHANGDQ